MDGARSRAVGVLEVVQTVREMAVAAVIATIAGFLQVLGDPNPPKLIKKKFPVPNAAGVRLSGANVRQGCSLVLVLATGDPARLQVCWQWPLQLSNSTHASSPFSMSGPFLALSD